MSKIFTTLGTLGGGVGGFFASGMNPMGAAAGASAGGALGALADGPGEQPEKNPRLQALLEVLEARANGSPFDQPTYQIQTGQAQENDARGAEDDAARAAMLGMNPGMAVAQGATARAKSGASSTRSAATDALNAQRGDQSALASLLGVDIAEDRYLEQGKQAKRQGVNQAFTTLGSAALPYLLGAGKPGSIYSTG